MVTPTQFKEMYPKMASNDCTCGDTTPYKPTDICAALMPFGSCVNCYPRGRPLTQNEKELEAEMLDQQLEKLDTFIKSNKK